jgi:hypothetical protein
MSRLKRALVPMLIAALAVPAAAAAQEPTGSAKMTPAAASEAVPEVRLSFGGRRPANPWAVVGSGTSAASPAQPRWRVNRVPAGGPVGGGTLLTNIEATTLAKGRLAAKKVAADGQGQSSFSWFADRPVLWLILIAAGVVVLLATGHSDQIPSFSGR